MLADAALAEWATPSAAGFEAVDLERMLERRAECKERTGNGNGFGLTLGQQAMLVTGPGLAGWATPSARDWKSGDASETTLARNARPLNEQAVNYCPPSTSGESSPAGTASTAGLALNPLHSLWLQGYPAAWLLCVGLGTRLIPASGRRSSKPSSKAK